MEQNGMNHPNNDDRVSATRIDAMKALLAKQAAATQVQTQGNTESVPKHTSATQVQENAASAPKRGSATQMQGGEAAAPKRTYVTQAQENEAPSQKRSAATQAQESGGSSAKRTSATQAQESGGSSAKRASATQAQESGGSSAKRASATKVQGNGNPAVHDETSVPLYENSSPERIMEQAKANAFNDIESFSAAAAKISCLVSSTGAEYTIRRTLSEKGGESVVLLCSAPDGTDAVAKIYFVSMNSAGHSIEARVKVLEYMQTKQGKKYTLPVTDIGLVNLNGSPHYFEIMPYCPDGDLLGKQLSFEEIVSLTERLNEALHSIHEAGLLHRDIKPDNLYWYKGNIVIGDFGVARLANGVGTHVVVLTDGYCAPEYLMSFNGIVHQYGSGCDYYSMGITLATLFEGHFVYEGIDDTMRSKCFREGKPPLMREHERLQELQNLLYGLCRYDQKYRFGYEDVKKWLMDHNYAGEVGSDQEEWTQAFRIGNMACRDERSLFEAITGSTEMWNKGMKMLYNELIYKFFSSFHPQHAQTAKDVNEEYRNSDDPDLGLAVFLRNLYPAGPLAWKGKVFRSLSELGAAFREDGADSIYAALLKCGCVSDWLNYGEGLGDVDDATRKAVADMEVMAQTDTRTACSWFANAFSGSGDAVIFGYHVKNIGDLLKLLFADPGRCLKHNWLDTVLEPKKCPELYGYLYGLGLYELVKNYRGRLEKGDTYERCCICFAMFEQIAEKCGVNPVDIRSFFVNYGPLGAAVAVKELVSRPDTVYKAWDADGKKIMAEIENFRLPQVTKIAAMMTAYEPLRQSILKMRKILEDNPYNIMAGIYQKKGIMALNLAGCFAYKIYGEDAPLYFAGKIGALMEGDKA